MNEDYAKLIYELHVADTLPAIVIPNWDIAYRIQSDTNNLMFLHIIPSYGDSGKLKFITIINQESLDYEGLVLDADFEDSTQVYNYLSNIGFTEIYEEYASLIGAYHDLGNCAQQNYIAQTRCGPNLENCKGRFSKHRDGWFKRLWKKVISWFDHKDTKSRDEDEGGGGGSSGDGSGNFGGGFGVSFGRVGGGDSGGESGSGGGGSSSHSSFQICTKSNIKTLEDVDFAIQKVDLFLSNYLVIRTATLLNDLLRVVKEDCLNESDFNACLIQSIGCDLLRDGAPFENSALTPYELGNYWLDCQGAINVEECIRCKEKAHIFIDQEDLDITVSELQGIIGNPSSCSDQDDYNIYAIEEYFSSYNIDYPFGFVSQYTNDCGILLKFLIDNNNSTESGSYIEAIIDLKSSNGNIRADRAVELFNTIINNPDILIENCTQNHAFIELNDYSDLFNHTIPNSCDQYLSQLGAGFENQPIGNGSSATVNLDYYGVEITEIPDWDNDGNPDSQEKLLEMIKEHFTTLASGSYLNFTPSCPLVGSADVEWQFNPYFGSTTTNKWLSNDPVTSIFLIDASATGSAIASTFADDGAVIVSQSNSCCWIFSTIQTPLSLSQPLSGNRQFGLRINSNNNVEFYTRAADRARLPLLPHIINSQWKNCAVADYFNIGEETWKNLQRQVKDFIIVEGGSSSISTTEAVRLDYFELYEKLQSTTPIQDVPCE
jgi:hypothetical protein